MSGLCDNCITRACPMQSGIERTRCTLYTPPSKLTNEEAAKIILNYDEYGCGYCHQGGQEIPAAFELAAKALRLLDELRHGKRQEGGRQ